MIINYYLIRGYAKTLFVIANKLNLNDTFLILLQSLSDFLKNPKLIKLIKNNLLNYEIKSLVLIDLIKQQLSINNCFNKDLSENQFEDLLARFNNFIKLVVQKKHLFLIHKIYNGYEKIYLEYTNSLKIEIVTAIDVQQKIKLLLQAQLMQYFNKKILINYAIDSSIIGGLIIKYKDQVIDFSLKGKLLRLKQRLIND